MEQKNEIAVFGGGCFWCTEALFLELAGVLSIASGYAGGTKENPTYEEICNGTTGHAEVIKIEYNPDEISYDTLLSVFFSTHDPTTINQQGSDVGAQYRSVILYTTEEQGSEAKEFIQKLEQEKTFDNPVVTELKSLEKFYEAEAEHQKFYEKNSNQPYCQTVINPKLAKLKEKYSHLLKSNEKANT